MIPHIVLRMPSAKREATEWSSLTGLNCFTKGVFQTGIAFIIIFKTDSGIGIILVGHLDSSLEKTTAS